MVSDAEEVTDASDPATLCLENARRKAEDIFLKLKTEELANENAAYSVIGADTAVFCDGRIFGKPVDAEEAAQMLRALSGKTHQVYTGVCVLRRGTEDQEHSFVECTDVHVAVLSEN